MTTAVKRRMARPERRTLIVDAAERAFRDRDPGSVTFEEIADEAGISRSLVYSYFKDRTELIEAVRERSEALLRAEVTQALSSARGRVEALAAAVGVHLRFARRDRTAYHHATGETPDRTRSATEARLVAEVADLYGGNEEATLIGLGLVHALRAMVDEHVVMTPGASDDSRAVALITAFLAGGLGGLAEIGIVLQPSWPVPLLDEELGT
jgi:AcrR family transcriptional regulator